MRHADSGDSEELNEINQNQLDRTIDELLNFI